MVMQLQGNFGFRMAMHVAKIKFSAILHGDLMGMFVVLNF
jgi:hypothetical protein